MTNRLIKNGKSIWDQEIILDGGMGVLLSSVEVDASPLWSGIANINSRDSVVDAHKKFINAGADAIISNTFFVNHTNLKTEMNMTEEQATETLLDTLNIAKEAVGDNETIVIGDIGPVADGPDTCYYPVYLARMTVDELEEWHERRFKVFAEDDRCDILGCETITGSKEVEALLRLMKKYPKDCYLSLACAISGPNELNSREPWDEVFRMIANNKPPSLKGIGINCSRPDVVSQFGKSAKAILPDLTLIAYPNSGEVLSWDEHLTFEQLKANPEKAKEMTAESYDVNWVGKKQIIADFVPEWKEIGFKWFGGCCRTTPDDIKNIRSAVFQK